MLSTAHTPNGVAWRFAKVTTYRRPLAHKAGRGMASSMPEAPLGTMTAPRDWDAFE
jgi:hypothetical protein